MEQFKGLTLEQALKSKPTFKTGELLYLLRVTSRSFNRWQNEKDYLNPMPKPLFGGKSSENIFDGGQLLDWYKTLPLKKRC